MVWSFRILSLTGFFVEAISRIGIRDGEEEASLLHPPGNARSTESP
jgi:hypothetical protein